MQVSREGQLIDLIKYLDLAVATLSSAMMELVNECENLLGQDKVRPLCNQSREDWVGMVVWLKEKLIEKKSQKDLIPTSSHKIDVLYDFMVNRSAKKSNSDVKFLKKKKCFISTCAYCAEKLIEQNSESPASIPMKKAKRLDENLQLRKIIDFNNLAEMSSSFIEVEQPEISVNDVEEKQPEI